MMTMTMMMIIISIIVMSRCKPNK